MPDVTALKTEFPTEVSQRRNGSQVRANSDATEFAVTGPERVVLPELATIDYFAEAGLAGPKISRYDLGSDGSAFFVSSSLGAASYSQLFAANIASGGAVSADLFQHYVRHVEELALTQVDISQRDISLDSQVVLDAICFDDLFARFPDRAEDLHRVRDRLVDALKVLPASLCHGDFGGSNLFPMGSIDFEHAFWGPMGFDAMSAATNFLWFPKPGTVIAEAYRPWHLSGRQIHSLLTSNEVIVRREKGEDPKEHRDALALMRGCWYLGLVRNKPHLEEWRTLRMSQALDAFIAGHPVIETLLRTEPKIESVAVEANAIFSGGNAVHIFGAGVATTRYHRPNVGELAPAAVSVFDVDPAKLASLNWPAATLAQLDAQKALPFRIDASQANTAVAIIATPMKLEPLARILEAGFKRVVVEKPLVNSIAEANAFDSLLRSHPDAKVFALESYCIKSMPLFYLGGQLPPDDPRVAWVGQSRRRELDPSLHGSLRDLIGDVTGIKATVFEGGKWGFPDLENIPYLMGDPVSGGMLLSLFSHAVHPLLASGLIDPTSLDVNSAELWTLHRQKDDAAKFERRWYSAQIGEIEARAQVELRSRLQGTELEIPVSVHVGKTWEPDDWRNWNTQISGTKGHIDFCTRRGGRLKVFVNGEQSPVVELYLKGDPYRLSLREAGLYFSGAIAGDGYIPNSLRIVRTIQQIKQIYHGAAI